MAETGLAVIFPGQGEQFVGMADVIDSSLLHRADEILGRPLSKLCAAGPVEELTQTRNAQPAMFLADFSYWRRVRPLLPSLPRFMAGHSLGEYAAYCAAGAIGFEDALRLVSRRAELMAAAAQAREGAMAAVIGLSSAEVGRLLSEGQTGVEIANYNSPQQTVISGPARQIEVISADMVKAGAKKVMRLAVSGAFHSPLMIDAASEFGADIDRAPIKMPEIPVVANTLARPATDLAELKGSLKRQIVDSVLWMQSMLFMAGQGVKVFVECGPGKVLSSLARRTLSDCSALTAGAYGDVELMAADIRSAVFS